MLEINGKLNTNWVVDIKELLVIFFRCDNDIVVTFRSF